MPLPSALLNRRSFGTTSLVCFAGFFLPRLPPTAFIAAHDFRNMPFENAVLEIAGAVTIKYGYTTLLPNFNRALATEIERVSGVVVPLHEIDYPENGEGAGLFTVYVFDSKTWRKYRLWIYSLDCLPDYPVTST